MPSSSSSRSLQCTECRQTFSRPSHLSRHRATHLTTAHRATIPCTRCEMMFSRRDVLLRHLRSVHQCEGRARRAMQKSCYRCVEKKLKCDRTRPCRACYRSGATCTYPSVDRCEGGLFSSNHGDSEAFALPPIRDEASRQHINQQAASTESSVYVQQIGSFEEGMVGSIATPDSLCDTAVTHRVDRTYATTNQMDLFTSLNAEPTISSRIEMAFDPVMPDTEDSLYQGTFALTPSSFQLMQPSFRTGGLDWLGVHIDDGINNTGLDVGGNFDISDIGLRRDCGIEEAGLAGTDRLGPSSLGQDWTTHNHTALRPQSAQQPSLPWPFDQGKDASLHQYKLPPLREVLSDNWLNDRPTRPSLVDGFIHLLSGSRLPQLHTLRDHDHVRAFDDLQRLVDVYFARFHDIQAIIHKPTWDMASCPTVLLTAMACLGAMLSDCKTDAELAPKLSDICSTMITWIGASDSTNYSHISYLNALCIHQIYSLGSGNNQLYQNADRSRGILIGGLRGVGLLQSCPNVNSEEEQEAIKGSSSGVALDLEWKSWISRESGRRAAWAAFEYDCSLCTLTSRRGIVDLSELPAFLPCADHLWSATSAQAWFALQSRLDTNNISPPLSKMLRLALAGRELPSALSFWAKRLCSQVIGRLLWDIKQLEVMAMPEYCGLGSLISAQRDSKASLLKGFNTLVESLSAPLSTSDLISYNISGLLCHYSHLYAVNDVLDIIVYIVRNLISSASQQQGLEVARQRLRMTLTSDPQTSRRLCWHAAQIVVIANEYLVSAPCEILRVFMGYIFILAYSAYGPRGSQTSDREGTRVRLDLSDRDISQKRNVTRWIEFGGPASFGSVPDLCADGCIAAISRDAQDMMQKMRCWGLADKFTRMFQVFETKGF